MSNKAQNIQSASATCTLHRTTSPSPQSSGVLRGNSRRRHDDTMGRDPAELTTPDLFSTDEVRDATPAPKDQSPAASVADTSSQRHILPKNLRQAVKQLSDGELDELFGAAFDEARRRNRLPPGVRTEMPSSALRSQELTTKRLTPTAKRRQVEIAEVSLTRGQVNAIRASFKAGITPSRIARQFGVSQSNVRKALATDPSR
jgi:hypothetical protein